MRRAGDCMTGRETKVLQASRAKDGRVGTRKNEDLNWFLSRDMTSIYSCWKCRIERRVRHAERSSRRRVSGTYVAKRAKGRIMGTASA